MEMCLLCAGENVYIYIYMILFDIGIWDIYSIGYIIKIVTPDEVYN